MCSTSMSLEPQARKRVWTEGEPSEDKAYSLHVYGLRETDGWYDLLHLNGGESAPCIMAAPGELHVAYMCCLVLQEAAMPTPKKQRQLNALHSSYREQPWWPYATRIAIVVPVAVQSGIAMAQGIKRLHKTCPCEHLRGLGMALLANVVRRFKTEYLFMSPIDEFALHVPRELTARNIPFGRLGERSLWWAVTNNDDDDLVEDKHQWLTMKEGDLRYERKGHFRERAVYFLKIRPQPPFQNVCRPRTMMLNAAHYVPRGGHDDPEYEPPPHVKTYETHDFLWFLAGDGVLVVHGPSFATMA